MAKTKEPRYKKFLGLIYIGISAVLIYTLTMNAFRVMNQREQLTRLQTQKAELEKEKKALSEKVDLLTDDDYAARYARDEYIFPKDGEEVVRLPDTKK
ncbi:FtsB family cell division protein [Candidatus Stoquefichus sp. SB1]|jgi:cell division protein DivIC|uniref:FtsB family cell division protein n=1 Tax=Candidatus Stoquefichus sp. SB1 TaxID=1658109 RepID=UPI00067EFF0E|nr:septum formation initiator family protein [Candidatus Stoquefichus sp. SB1]